MQFVRGLVLVAAGAESLKVVHCISATVCKRFAVIEFNLCLNEFLTTTSTFALLFYHNFETKGDPAITKEVGQMLYDTFQDKRQMYAVYYTYFHLIADMIRAHSPEKRSTVRHDL